MDKWKNNIILLFVATVLLYCCKKKSEDPVNQICTYIPTYIDTVINLSDRDFYSLRTIGVGYTRFGLRRIILYKVTDTEYRAFDQVSSYKMAEVGCKLKVDNSVFFMVDTCSGSKFDMEGNVIQGPALCPLLKYNTSFVSSDQLRIYHTQ